MARAAIRRRMDRHARRVLPDESARWVTDVSRTAEETRQRNVEQNATVASDGEDDARRARRGFIAAEADTAGFVEVVAPANESSREEIFVDVVQGSASAEIPG